MDLREARELLGVTPADDEKKVRRKYLRAVKKHKPERDPEGFQRVREAFEIARVNARIEEPPGSENLPVPMPLPLPLPSE